MEHLRDELEERGVTPEHCAWFRPFDSEALEHGIHLMEEFGRELLDATTVRAPNPVPPEPVHGDRRDLGDHVAVAVSGDEVTVWSVAAPHVLGDLVATFHRGAFRTHAHHYPERVDLTLEDEANGRMSLAGSWTHLEGDCLRTAHAAAALASGPAH